MSGAPYIAWRSLLTHDAEQRAQPFGRGGRLLEAGRDRRQQRHDGRLRLLRRQAKLASEHRHGFAVFGFRQDVVEIVHGRTPLRPRSRTKWRRAADMRRSTLPHEGSMMIGTADPAARQFHFRLRC
jgi:hypothetical protein